MFQFSLCYTWGNSLEYRHKRNYYNDQDSKEGKGVCEEPISLSSILQIDERAPSKAGKLERLQNLCK